MSETDNIIRTRAQAKALGLTRYFTGKPCPQGHVTDRQVSSAGCCECSRIKDTRRDRSKEPKKDRSAYFKLRRQTEHGKTVEKAARLRYVYGISVENYDEKLLSQGHKCACCRTPFDSSRKNTTPQVDHDHSTGNVREILCRDCNVGLGFAKEDVNVLESWIQYLRRHNGS